SPRRLAGSVSRESNRRSVGNHAYRQFWHCHADRGSKNRTRSQDRAEIAGLTAWVTSSARVDGNSCAVRWRQRNYNARLTRGGVFRRDAWTADKHSDHTERRSEDWACDALIERMSKSRFRVRRSEVAESDTPLAQTSEHR